ncbi:hypothetical protein ScPMuIL_004429 [Solemya velum]
MASWCTEPPRTSMTTTRKVLDRIREINPRLAAHKCQYKLQEVPHIGHVLSKDGLKPDPEKVRAISDMPTPQDASDLLRFLGMVKYLAKFVPNLSEKAAPLNELSRKDNEWQWNNAQQQAFDEIKQNIAQVSNLVFFRRHKRSDTDVRLITKWNRSSVSAGRESKFKLYLEHHRSRFHTLLSENSDSLDTMHLSLLPGTIPLYPSFTQKRTRMYYKGMAEHYKDGVPRSRPTTTLTLYTDASLLGWGAELNGHTIQEPWSMDGATNHINVQEMCAVLLGADTFSFLDCVGNCYRQHNSSYIHREAGWHSFFSLLLTGLTDLVTLPPPFLCLFRFFTFPAITT